jgi:hypothetical protein
MMNGSERPASLEYPLGLMISDNELGGVLEVDGRSNVGEVKFELTNLMADKRRHERRKSKARQAMRKLAAEVGWDGAQAIKDNYREVIRQVSRLKMD